MFALPHIPEDDPPTPRKSPFEVLSLEENIRVHAYLVDALRASGDALCDLFGTHTSAPEARRAAAVFEGNAYTLWERFHETPEDTDVERSLVVQHLWKVINAFRRTLEEHTARPLVQPGGALDMEALRTVTEDAPRLREQGTEIFSVLAGRSLLDEAMIEVIRGCGMNVVVGSRVYEPNPPRRPAP